MILIGSTLIILTLITVVVLAIFINQKRKFRDNKKVADIQHKFDREILRAQLEIQTQTYEAVSKELHDNVSNTISLALLNLNLLQSQKDPDAAPKIEEAKNLMIEAKNAVRDFAWNINPSNIAHQGLRKSLNELAEKFKTLDIFRISFASAGQEFDIEPPAQIIIYRIVQEAVTNAVKHSQCSEVLISLEFEKPGLQASVRDNGCGFDTATTDGPGEGRKGSGIGNMLSRAKMIGAKLSLSSEPGQGTLIRLKYSANRGEKTQITP